MRDRALITNPEPQAVLRANDLVGLVGDEGQLKRVQEVFAASGEDAQTYPQSGGP
jgi:K+/H+ antiporter YhaU regulatory subunit KhtT